VLFRLVVSITRVRYHLRRTKARLAKEVLMPMQVDIPETCLREFVAQQNGLNYTRVGHRSLQNIKFYSSTTKMRMKPCSNQTKPKNWTKIKQNISGKTFIQIKSLVIRCKAALTRVICNKIWMLLADSWSKGKIWIKCRIIRFHQIQ
jgi:hypothetical protein